MKKFGHCNKVYLGMLAGVVAVMMFCSHVEAAALSMFGGTSDWTMFADSNDDIASHQVYDHEYFFYKRDNNKLSIGIQSGFDLVDGYFNFYMSDMALSFDGDVNLIDGTGYEYGFDFGLYTKNFVSSTIRNEVDFGSGTGIDTAGLYKVSKWDNNTKYHSRDGLLAAPFAIDEIDGSIVADAEENYAGLVGSSYYRVVTFDIADLLAQYGGSLKIDAHITMSCGNDVQNGKFDIELVPEPATVALLGIGIVGLAGAEARRRRKKKTIDN